MPLIAAPKLIVTMLSPEVRDATCMSQGSIRAFLLLTGLLALEVYLSRSLGLSLLSIGILSVLLTGSVPLSSRLSDGVTTDAGDPKAPYAVPTLTVTTLYHTASAFYCYALWTSLGVAGFALGLTGSTVLAAIGGWSLLFASSDGKISRKTGADKRTSGFPFKNSEAAKRKGKNL